MLKELGYSYKRFKKHTAKDADKELVNSAKKDIDNLEKRQRDGTLDIYYYDESSF